MGKDGEYREGVVAIIIDTNNKYLIIQKNSYAPNEWTLVGGGKENDESIYENLFREVKEETGLTPDDYQVIGVSKHKNEYKYPENLSEKIHSGRYIGQSYTQVAVKLNDEKVKRKLVFEEAEIRTHQWVAASELKDKFIFEGQYEIIKKAIDDLLSR